MNDSFIEIIPDSYKKTSFNSFLQCFNLIQEGNFSKAQNISKALLTQYKNILRKQSWGTDGDKNFIFIFAVGIKALEDYSEIGEMTSDINWSENTQTVENVWIKLWDCKERVEYILENFQGNLFHIVLQRINELHAEYINTYGNGLYSSPEFLIKKEICSICGQNVKACLHISGNIYDGQICKYLIEDFEFKNISLVTVPKDPRCRIWSWNVEGRTIEGMAYFFKSGIDSFLAD